MNTPPCSYAITGATGYLGRVLTTKLLHQGHRVVAVVRNPERAQALLPASARLRFAVADLTSRPPLPELSGCQGLFHLAASLDMFGSPHQHELNVGATEHLANVADDAGIQRMVFASSLEATGVAAPTHARREDELGQRSPYGESKLLAETRLAEICAESGLESVAARIGIVYGGAQDLWVPGLLSLLSTPEAAWLADLDETIVDCIHVDDVAAGLIALLHTRGTRACFHLTGGPLRLGTVVGLIRNAAGLQATPDNQVSTGIQAHIDARAAKRQADLWTYLGWPTPANASRWLSRQALDDASSFRPEHRFETEAARIVQRVLSTS